MSLMPHVIRVKIHRDDRKFYGVDEKGSKYSIDKRFWENLHEGDEISIKLGAMPSYGSKVVPYYIPVPNSELQTESYGFIQRDSSLYPCVICIKNNKRFIYDIQAKKSYVFSSERYEIEETKLEDLGIDELEKFKLVFVDLKKLASDVKKVCPVLSISESKKK